MTILVNANLAQANGVERLRLVLAANAPAGRLSLSRNDYCAIWNGYVSPWNDPTLNDLRVFRNGGVPLADNNR